MVFSANIVFESLPLSLWRLVHVTFEDVWISFKALYTTPRLDFRHSLVSGPRPSQRGLLSRTAAGDGAYTTPYHNMNNSQNRTLASYVAIKYNFDTNLWLGYFFVKCPSNTLGEGGGAWTGLEYLSSCCLLENSNVK